MCATCPECGAQADIAAMFVEDDGKRLAVAVAGASVAGWGRAMPTGACRHSAWTPMCWTSCEMGKAGGGDGRSTSDVARIGRKQSRTQ